MVISLHTFLFSERSIWLRVIPLLLSMCSIYGESSHKNSATAKGEYIYRTHDEFLFIPPLPERQPPSTYPWHRKTDCSFPTITKDFFRCRGNGSRQPLKIEQGGQRYINDCDGSNSHSLPVRDGQEHIYAILIELLNHLQRTTQKQVVITSGHRCPDHHLYIDQSPEQQYSKHMIGAEVDFYVKGLEDNPQLVVDLIKEYYTQTPIYQNQSDYQDFSRWDSDKCNTSTPPWYNKEVFIKLYKADEGRNLDNDHHHPYISLQVRYDRDKKEKVNYSWDRAFHGYFRH